MSLPILTRQSGATPQIDLYANSLTAPTITTDTLIIDGVPLSGVFAPPPSDRNITSSFFNGSIPVTFKVVGTANQFTITTREFNVPGASRTGNQDIFYVEVPHLLNYNLSGIIPYSYDENIPVFQIAVCWKLTGISQMYITPVGSFGFDPAVNPGATLYFSQGHISGSSF